jgi:hypothetical protein
VKELNKLQLLAELQLLELELIHYLQPILCISKNSSNKSWRNTRESWKLNCRAEAGAVRKKVVALGKSS